MKSKDLLVRKGSPDGGPSSPKAMKSKDLLVRKVSPDGSSSSPKAMTSKDLLVRKDSPDGSPSSPKRACGPFGAAPGTYHGTIHPRRMVVVFEDSPFTLGEWSCRRSQGGRLAPSGGVSGPRSLLACRQQGGASACFAPSIGTGPWGN